MRRLAILIGMLLAFSVAAGGALASLPNGGTFIDDDGNVHEPNIEAIASAGVTKQPRAPDRAGKSVPPRGSRRSRWWQ